MNGEMKGEKANNQRCLVEMQAISKEQDDDMADQFTSGAQMRQIVTLVPDEKTGNYKCS
jgi:hypothetical protein